MCVLFLKIKAIFRDRDTNNYKLGNSNTLYKEPSKLYCNKFDGRLHHNDRLNLFVHLTFPCVSDNTLYINVLYINVLKNWVLI